MPSEEYAALCEQTEQDKQSFQVKQTKWLSVTIYVIPRQQKRWQQRKKITFTGLPLSFQIETPRSENSSFLSEEEMPSKNL